MPLFSCLQRGDRIFGLMHCLPVKLSQQKKPTYIYFYLHSKGSASVVSLVLPALLHHHYYYQALTWGSEQRKNIPGLFLHTANGFIVMRLYMHQQNDTKLYRTRKKIIGIRSIILQTTVAITALGLQRQRRGICGVAS